MSIIDRTPPGAPEIHALSEGVFARAHALIRRLAIVTGAAVGAAALLLAAIAIPAILPRPAALASEALRGGLAGVVLPALLLSTLGVLATLLLTIARQRPSFAESLREAQPFATLELRGPASPGFAARVGQGVLMPLGAALIGTVIWAAWPAANAAVAPGDAELLAALVFGLGFILLVCERVLHALSAAQLPEAPTLRRLLLLTTLLLVIAACAEIGRAVGLAAASWVFIAAACLPGLVAAELAIRAAARLFLPAPANERATAVTESILAALLTGGPRAPAALIRTHLGVDFARSWALQFLARAALPAVFATGLLCWALSGLKLIDGDARGVYERLGAPVAVLGPGLHLLLPWPLGRLRPVEFGTIHAIAIGSDAPPEGGEAIGAEATPPASANRLWETAHATEVNYLVASQSGARDSLELVSTEILVLTRTGLTDRDAYRAVYGAADPQGLVREAASRLATRYFGRRTLAQVMGDQPSTLAEQLRRDLAEDVARAQAGIEVLAVVIEEIHPPAGAASAYHMVQAAEINANASISDEIGRATRMRGVAQQEAHQMQDAAEATATEARTTAEAAAYRFQADRAASAAAPAPFLLERRLADLSAALAQAPLTLLDHRLEPTQGPLLDLRPLTPTADLAGALAPATPPAAPERPAANPGSFTYVTPNSTADTTPPTPDAIDATPGEPRP